jgi:hypothetical protein
MEEEKCRHFFLADGTQSHARPGASRIASVFIAGLARIARRLTDHPRASAHAIHDFLDAARLLATIATSTAL